MLTSDWRLYVGSPLENIGADNAGAVFVMAVNATSFEVGEADVMAVPGTSVVTVVFEWWAGRVGISGATCRGLAEGSF